MYKRQAELTCTIYQLSKGVKNGGASDDRCDALEALHIDPGQQPSKSSAEAANTWFSLKDDQETAEAIALDLQADILSVCNENSVDENNGGEDSGDSGCEDKCRESEAVVRPPPYAEVAEEVSTLEAKARISTCLFTLQRPGWHGSELMPVVKRANIRTSAFSLTLEVRHGRVRLLCSEYLVGVDHSERLRQCAAFMQGTNS